MTHLVVCFDTGSDDNVAVVYDSTKLAIVVTIFIAILFIIILICLEVADCCRQALDQCYRDLCNNTTIQIQLKFIHHKNKVHNVTVHKNYISLGWTHKRQHSHLEVYCLLPHPVQVPSCIYCSQVNFVDILIMSIPYTSVFICFLQLPFLRCT